MATRLYNHFLHALVLGSAMITLGGASATGHCPPFGPVFPASTSPSKSPDVQNAIVSIVEDFDNMTSEFEFSAVSIGVRSIHENLPLILKQYTPPVLSPGATTKVDPDTVFRIGSSTKLFTMLAILKLPGISLDDPILKYLPELSSMARSVGAPGFLAPAWDDITLGSLASHLSGIGVDFATDLTNYPINWTALGLPTVNASFSPNCAGLFGIPPCNSSDFYRGFGNHDVVFAPFTSPVYSNIGYAILALVVESVSNTTFETFVQEEILDPLGMNTTALSSIPGAEGEAFALADDPFWGSDIGFEDPTGAYYSTTNDLLRFATAILDNTLLSPVQTRKWLKPRTSTSSPGTQLGDVWEIYRSADLTSDKRLIEVYTKSGDLGNYHSMLALVPDYDVVITILVAGNETSSFTGAALLSDIVTRLLPALETAGRSESGTNLAGTYRDEAANSTLTLSLDEGPGFSVAEWTVRGVDFLSHFAAFADPLSPPAADAQPVPARLYPTDARSDTQQAWRAVFETTNAEERAQQDAAVFWEGGSCVTWAGLDRLVYQYKALDEVMFTLEGGSATGLVLPAFEVELKRTNCSA